jgi:hypothetical protein
MRGKFLASVTFVLALLAAAQAHYSTFRKLRLDETLGRVRRAHP